MKSLKSTTFFVIDVESIGLYGDPFAVGWNIITPMPKNENDKAMHQYGGFDFKENGYFAINRKNPKLIGSEEDRKWINENIQEIPTNMFSLDDLLESFWNVWIAAKNTYPGIVMAADCMYPVESNFLAKCATNKNINERKWEAPYPLLEISTIMLTVGMNPMENYERLPNELPKHNPLADAMQSSRLLIEAIGRLPKY